MNSRYFWSPVKKGFCFFWNAYKPMAIDGTEEFRIHFEEESTGF